jgi:glucose/arabinose dehydrogenase
MTGQRFAAVGRMSRPPARLFLWTAAALLFSTTVSAQLRSETVITGLSQPVAFVQDPADASVQFVVQQTGRIRVIQNGVLQTTPFLDLSASITAGGEQGLLGMALPADTATSRRFFVYFNNPAGDIVVARFKRSPSNPLTADPSSRFDLRWSTGENFIRHPVNSNHNGGMIAFGPDGYLYLGVGDGGSGNDPAHNAQNMAVLLGKILRIDVSVPDSHAAGLTIPPDNPFPSGTRPEIWDIGLRNPWKFSFDDPARGGTGALVIGDVGQGAWEEVNYEPAGRGGVNYGWRNREGAHDNVTSLPPAFTPLTDPIFEYPHPTGFSITGGYVYRGVALGSSYRGRYFFADFVAAKIWSIALTVNPSTGEATASDLRNHTTELGSHGVSGFGVDAAGELYILDYAGSVLRVAAVPSSLAPTMSIDIPSHGQDVSPPFVVAGWALDPLATSDPGIDAIHVWAYPIAAIGSPTTGSPVFVGATGLGVQRPDVAQAFGGSHFTGSGFGLIARGLAPGTYRLVVFGLVRATGTFGVARAVDVRVLSGVRVALDVPGTGATMDRPFVVAGWAIDLAAASGNGIDAVHVWGINTAQPGTLVFLGAATSFSDRPDVANVFGPQFTTSGYNILVNPASAGVWDLFVFPRNATTGQFEAATTRRVTVR